MVQIRQLDDDSLLPILEQDLVTESEGSTRTITKTVTDPVSSSVTLPRVFFGGVFAISAYSDPVVGEIDAQRTDREARNANGLSIAQPLSGTLGQP